MHTLLISNMPARSWSENVLRISYLPQSAEFEFKYSQYYADTHVDEKRYPESEAWDTLARFVRYKFGVLLPSEGKA